MMKCCADRRRKRKLLLGGSTCTGAGGGVRDLDPLEPQAWTGHRQDRAELRTLLLIPLLAVNPSRLVHEMIQLLLFYFSDTRAEPGNPETQQRSSSVEAFN